MSQLIKTIILTSLLGYAFIFSKAQTNENFNWDKVMDAVTFVESRGQANAYNPKSNCAGVLQITPICVAECNNILKAKGKTERYTLKDRYNVQKSREMFVLIQEKHNPTNDIERAIRMWNAGPGYTKNLRITDGYYKKVMAKYREIVGNEEVTMNEGGN